jgi:hypothetical protein
MRYRVFVCLVVTVSLLSSCKKDEPTTWESNWVAPLAHGRLTLSDLTADNGYTDNAGIYHLYFEKIISGFGTSDLTQIPDTNISQKFVVPITGGPFQIPGNTAIITQNQNYSVETNGTGLRMVKVKSGQMIVHVKSYVNAYLHPSFTLYNVSEVYGNNTDIDFALTPGSASAPTEGYYTIDMSNKYVVLSGTSGFDYNKLSTHLEIKTEQNTTADQNTIYGQDSVRFELIMSDLVIDYAKGYFGNDTYSFNETFNLAESANMPTGLLELDQASFGFHVTHKMGFDGKLKIDNVMGLNTYMNTGVQLTGGNLYNPFFITRSIDNGGTASVSNYDINLNEGNSNITSFMGSLPYSVLFTGSLQLNPFGNVSDGNDFLYSDQLTEAKLVVDVPLRLAASDLKLRDTLNVEVTTDAVRVSSLTLDIQNAFPMEWKLNLTTLGGAIVATDLNVPSGNSIDALALASSSTLVIPISEAQWNAIKSEGKLIMQVISSTPSFPQLVNLYNSYFVDMRVKAGVVLNAEIQ